MKMAKCIVELERIYGIKNGGDRKSDEHNVNVISQKNLAENIGVTQQQLNRYKKLNTLIPELQDMIEDGELKATTAQLVWSKLSQYEQEKFFNEIGKEQISKMTQTQTDEYIKLQQEVEHPFIWVFFLFCLNKKGKFNVVKSKYYTLYSINLLRFIKAHGIRHVSKGVNPKTERTYWIFEINDELSRVLKTWTDNKSKTN